MKKAIFTFSLLTLSSPVFAGELAYSIEGKSDTLYGYSDVSERFEHKDDNNKLTNASNISSFVEYQFNKSTKASLNLELMVGFNKENHDYNNGDWGKEIYAEFENETYGTLTLGEHFNVAYQLSEGAPKVGAIGVNNSALVDFISNPNWQRKKHHTAYKTLNSTAINTDGVAPKVSYLSPVFYDTQVGLTYVPDIDNRRGLVNSRAHYDNDDGYIASIRNEYDLGFADLSTSLGYAVFRHYDKEMSAGVSLFRGGWTLASSYRKTYVDGKKDPISMYDSYREGYAWDMGLSYEIGPYEVGLSYFTSKADNTDNEDRIVMLSNKYQINKWANVYLVAAHVDYKGEDKSVENNNKGYSFITGFGLEF